ncbi:hypothetical protein [Microbacterium sp. SS28]|uniref:hypothetical protein n=1 Tax=Microbacterium sp. SS28 TaxID=2919948 RepID=UPI001FAAE5D3|nr:hypothetical protein [Microbacterium sp. SS28]
MDTMWGAAAGGDGLLPAARHALATMAATTESIRAETAWECEAARRFRARLGRLDGELEALRDAARVLEHELRDAWARSSVGMR